jgi:hypothetical protein
MKKVSIEQKKILFDDFFKVEEAYLRFEQFNGEMSPRIRRLNMDRDPQQRHRQTDHGQPVSIPHLSE